MFIMDIYSIIGLSVRSHRVAKNLTQEELAARSGVSQQYISGLEGGLRNPTVQTLFHISIALEIEVTDLFKAPL